MRPENLNTHSAHFRASPHMPSAYIFSFQSLNTENVVLEASRQFSYSLIILLIMASVYLVAAVAFAILGYILKVRTGKD